MNNIILIRSNYIENDPPLQKLSGWLNALGFNVDLIAYTLGSNDNIAPTLKVTKRNFGKFSIFSRFILMFRMLKILRKKSPSIIYCVDFDCLFIICCLITLLRINVKIYYHEFDDIINFSSVPKRIKPILRYLESICMQKVHTIVLPDKNRVRDLHVCNSMAFINNAPDISYCPLPRRPIRTRLSICYIGGFSSDRNLIRLCEVVKSLPKTYELVIGGYGTLYDDIEKYAVCENITFLGQVDAQSVSDFQVNSDILFAAYDAKYEINKVAAPNKFFEAVAFGKSLFVSEGTGIDSLVESLNCGLILSDDSWEKSFENYSRAELHEHQQNSIRAYLQYNSFESERSFNRMFA